MIVAVAWLAGCSGLSSDDELRVEDAAPQFAEGDTDALEACLEGMGFPADAIEQWPSMDHPAWQDKRWEHQAKVCAHDAGLIDYPAADPAYVESRNAKFVALIECIESRGWELPEPRVDTDGSLIPVLPFATENPESLEASKRDFRECGDEVGFPILPPDPEQEPSG